VKFHVAVHEFGEFARLRMFDAVPLLIGGKVLEPEVCAQIDNPFGERGQEVKALHELRVRQSHEEKVHLLQFLHGAEIELGLLSKIGVEASHRFSGVSFRGHLVHLNLGMLEKEPQQFASCVA